jgi:hypothetical protein
MQALNAVLPQIDLAQFLFELARNLGLVKFQRAKPNRR